MKRAFILLLCLILAILTTACGNGESKNAGPAKNVELSDYLKTAKLPQNLSVVFNASKVKSIGRAKTYKADYISTDKDVAVKNLLLRPVVKTQSYAMGPWYQTGDAALTEYLNLYDGGKSFHTQSSLNGGLIYSKVLNGVWKADKLIVDNNAGSPIESSQLRGYGLKSDYSSKTDLSFMSYEDARTAAEGKLSALGFPAVEVSETYFLDLATLQKEYALYRKAESDPFSYTYSKDDECYLFFFRQVVDGIPLVDVFWQSGLPALGDATETSAAVYYSKDGIERIAAHGFYGIKQTEKENDLITAAQAFHQVLSSYAGTLVDKETKIVSLELEYVALGTDGSYELVPAWVFITSKAMQSLDSNRASFTEYSYYVVNAVTGKRIEKSGKGGTLPVSGKESAVSR